MNSSPEESAAGAAGGVGGVKRKNLMTNVKSRLNSEYDVEKYARRNEKDLQTKVKFFEKKMVNGTFKEFMRPRMEEAKTLLARVQAMRSTPLAAKAPVPPVRVVKAANTTATQRAPVRVVKPADRAKPAPPPVPAALPPVAEDEEMANEYLYEASKKYLPLPQFYDPYTGRKIPAEESPLTPIERAYRQLKTIRRKAYKNAATLRAAALKTQKSKKTRRTTRR